MEVKVNLEQLKEVSAQRIESVHISQQNPTFQYFGDAGNISNILPALNNKFLPPPPPGEVAPAFDGFNNMNLTMMQTAPPFPEFNSSNFNYPGQDMLHTLVPLPPPLPLSLPPPPPPPAVIENEVQQQNLQENAQDFPPGFNNEFY